MTPAELFQSKFENVVRICRHRAARYRLRPDDAADVEQQALLVLWQQCLRPRAGRIDCAVVALAGWSRCTQKRPPLMASIDALNANGDTLAAAIPARERSVRVDGVTYTQADANLDHPGEWLTMKQVATRLGVTKQYVHQMRHELGAVRVGCGWRFPPRAGAV